MYESTCNVCGRKYHPAEGCDCIEYLHDHAEQSAYRAVENGLWSGYDGTVTKKEWVADGPRKEDARDLVARYGSKTKAEMDAWNDRWKSACIELHEHGRILHWQEREHAKLDEPLF